jgi:hypothetical protein
MKYFYSITRRDFTLDDGMLAYEAVGSLPADLQEMSEADYLAFFNPPDGFAGIFDENGPRVSRLPELDPVAIAKINGGCCCQKSPRPFLYGRQKSWWV